MFPQMFLGKQNVSVTNSETFDVSHRAFFKIYTGGAKAPPLPHPTQPLCWPSLNGFAFPQSIKSPFLSENENRKNRAEIT